MKISTSLSRSLIIALGTLSMASFSPVMAADTPAGNTNTTDAANAPAASAPAKLPYGVDDVLKLSRADVSDDIIVKYVQNSGTIYNLSPKDIVYLHSQGVSDRVINAMLEQRQRFEAAAQNQAQATTPNSAPPNSGGDAGAAESAPENSPPANPPPTVQAPLTPPASSTYAIPYAPAPYYGYYPYYGPYYGVWGPTIVFGFGGHGYYYHGYHGGYYHGGGYHGGGYHGGHH